MIKIVQGDILNAPENVICHQVNCQGVMGSGLAKQIKNKYPIVYEEYREQCNKYCPQQIFGKCLGVEINNNQYIANLFGQFNYGRDKQHTDYEKMKEAMLNLALGMLDKNLKSIAIPYGMGCGLGGGDWNIVYHMIEEVLGDYDVVIYKFQ